MGYSRGNTGLHFKHNWGGRRHPQSDQYLTPPAQARTLSGGGGVTTPFIFFNVCVLEGGKKLLFF